MIRRSLVRAANEDEAREKILTRHEGAKILGITPVATSPDDPMFEVEWETAEKYS